MSKVMSDRVGYISAFLLIILVGIPGCILHKNGSFDKDGKVSSFKDTRDGKRYKTINLIGKTWFAENLNYNTGEGSWYYKNNVLKGMKYGRLYNWEAAKLACPPGWRLPTYKEWGDLVKHFGGLDTRETYKALVEGGEGSFTALLGGERNPNGRFRDLGEAGYYWTGTEVESQKARFYSFYDDYSEMDRLSSVKSFGLSCRCIKD